MALIVKPRVAGLTSAIAWLRDRDVPTKSLAGMLGITETYLRQLAFRGQWAMRGKSASTLRLPNLTADLVHPLPDDVRSELGIRRTIDSFVVKLDPAARAKVTDLEERVEQLGAEFWSGVPFGTGIGRLREVLMEIGRPSHYRRIRVLARVRQLIAETYAHSGYSASAIREGTASALLSKAAYDESSDAFDLDQYAKTLLIISQAHLLRQEPELSAHCLDLHRDARHRINASLGGEYFRQRGAVAFQDGGAADDEARKNFTEAARVLSETVEYGRTKQLYEVLNIGRRQMNLLGGVDWDASQELFDYMRGTLPGGEIHISMNLNWTTACGFSTDSPSARQRAMELLERYRGASVGFGHQATVVWLLSLTPSLPKNLRARWVRRALYENTFRNQ